MDIENSTLRTIAEQVALEAAEVVSTRRQEVVRRAGNRFDRELVSTKSSEVDPVTVVDTATERFLVTRLKELRPDDGLLGEEGSNEEGSSGISWIIDPIDGTVNFLYGVPFYAVSVAAAHAGQVLAGAVVNVVSGELYSAARGEGATLLIDGERSAISVNSETDLAQALLATGFSYSAEWRSQQGRILADVIPHVRDVRRLGSAALDLCHVAAGRVDCYYEHGTHSWDWAAGALIAEEAGAAVVVPDVSVGGAEGRVTMAAAPALAEPLKELLTTVNGWRLSSN